MTGTYRSASAPVLLLALLISAALLAGCSGPTPTVVPTVDQLPTFSAIQTQAVQTVAAELTRSAPTATEIPTETPVVPPTETLVPTNTPEPTVALPTATATRPVVVVVPTITLTPTQAAFQCSIVEQSPAAGAQFAKQAEFDAKWKIKNTGTNAWQRENVDFKYVSGEKMQKFADLYDLPESVNPNGQITLVLDMIAPESTGRSTTTWALVDGSTTICTLTLSINVQ